MQPDNPYKSIDSYSSTVKQLADQARTRTLTTMTEAQFARLCMDFDRRIASGSDKERYARVLRVLDKNPSPQTQRLAMIWLDGHGYGHITLANLKVELYLLREHGIGGADPEDE